MLYVHDDHQGSIYAVVTAKIYLPVPVGAGTGTLPATRQIAFVIKSSDVDRKEWTVMNPEAYGNPVYGYTSTDASKNSQGNESKLAHLADGSLLMSIRTYKNSRRYYMSTDDGKTWSKYATGMTDPDCNGDLMTINYNAKTYILQSLPNSSSAREKVSIYCSADNGKTWTLGKEICSGASAYSSLTRLWDGTVGVLVEEGDDTNGYSINFYTLNMTDILPAQTISDTYDGTLVCNGKGYLTVPASTAFNVGKSGKKTITCRVLLNDFTYSDDHDFGVLSTRSHLSATTLNQYRAFAGYEIIAGKNEDESIGANVTIDNSTKGTGRRVLQNSYFSAIQPSRWAHVAMVFDFEEGNVKVYVDGTLKETQTKEITRDSDKDTETGLDVQGASITTKGNVATGTSNTPNASVSYDLLIGTRYDFDVYEALSSYPWTKYYSAVSTSKIFNSNIDDVRIYNEALSAEDVLEDKNSGFPIRTKDKGLLAAYDFADQDREFSNSTFNDISGNSHNGTLVATDSYTFPTIEHNIDVTPVTTEGGTLTVTRFNYGDEIKLTNDKAYTGTLNQDYKATAVADDGWVLIGIYVNGTQVPNNGFFKAGQNAEVKALFRKLEEINFYLVGNAIEGKEITEATNSYKFVYDETERNYTLSVSGKLEGTFHVIGVDKDTNEIVLDLYAADAANAYGNKTMETGTPYDVTNTTDGTSFSVYEKGDVSQGHFITGADFTFVYTNTTKTLALKNIAKTGVEDIATDTTDAAVEYFNLQGVRVNYSNATPGVYIRRQGNTATKVIKK
jgi:hypothetical protein